jgi:hypothetical protein
MYPRQAIRYARENYVKSAAEAVVDRNIGDPVCLAMCHRAIARTADELLERAVGGCKPVLVEPAMVPMVTAAKDVAAMLVDMTRHLAIGALRLTPCNIFAGDTLHRQNTLPEHRGARNCGPWYEQTRAKCLPMLHVRQNAGLRGGGCVLEDVARRLAQA